MVPEILPGQTFSRCPPAPLNVCPPTEIPGQLKRLQLRVWKWNFKMAAMAHLDYVTVRYLDILHKGNYMFSQNNKKYTNKRRVF